MDKIAFVFAGQGTQYSGMGKDLYQNSTAAAKVFDSCEEIRRGLKDLCFCSSAQELMQTANTQPALFAMNLACGEAAKEAGVFPDLVAGFSLGEVAAVAFSGRLDYTSAFEYVCLRGKYMQECAQQLSGGMAAVLKLDNSTVEELCSGYEQVFPANYNCQGQLVVAGNLEQLDKFLAEVKEKGGRGVKLKVSGAFHTPFMHKAAEKLQKVLEGYEFREGLPVYSNVTGEVFGSNMAQLMARQIESPVLWEKTINNMVAKGVNTFVEVGAGKVLSGLIAKICPSANIMNIEKYSDIAGIENLRRG